LEEIAQAEKMRMAADNNEATTAQHSADGSQRARQPADCGGDSFQHGHCSLSDSKVDERVMVTGIKARIFFRGRR
jgi:hypothetical protein